MTTTLILGASDNPERYANKAQKRLLENGHQVVLVNPKGGTIEGIECLTSLTAVKEPIDTVTVYVNPNVLNQQLTEIIALHPRRVIMNPGTENPEIAKQLTAANIEVVEACTLVLLSLGSY